MHPKFEQFAKVGGRQDAPSPPIAGGGDPPHDDGMEARVAKLESTADHILRELVEMKADIRELRRDAKTDFRLLFGAIITVALGLAALMAKGFHWL
ncbi:hypothetical protein [Xanthomonas sp. 1678]|uniref:hypothetical protein n=1 Tax=Xanthomonas sp. 1678 TaxID=3158788 RepID=UPI00285BB570|nr:hypothetical protein [Xanthomonas translucens]